ncbi:MAG: efflux RND transporter permease subunit [Pseudomonadota bacterium]
MKLTPSSAAPRNLVSVFIRHPNAANLLMVLMILFGLFALARINTQFFPTIERNSVTISVAWSGASPEDVEQNVLAIVEPEVRFINGVDEINSYAREGTGSISLTFTEGYDMAKAVADVEDAARAITALPEDAEDPKVSASQFFDRVASISIGGDVAEATVRRTAKRIRDELIEGGIDRVTFTGLRSPELQIAISDYDLRRLGVTIDEVALAVTRASRDRPSGALDGDVERQLRTVAAETTPRALGDIEIRSFASGEKIFLRDVATIADTFDESGVRGLSKGGLAIELDIMATPTADTLTSNAILAAYVEELRPQLATGLDLQVYEVRAAALGDRIMLLIENGLTGLAIVLVVLFLFLNARIAFWVAVGIPVALLATIGIMYVLGQTINMFSLFALIMMLGVIVDDAIVVGEHTDTRLQMGDDPVSAAENGVGAMFTPVTAALTTTLATFLPLLLITGTIGQIVAVLPVVVAAVAIASLVECFFILPGHLSHALAGQKPPRWSWWRVFFIGLGITLFCAAFFTRFAGEGGFISQVPWLLALDAMRTEQEPFVIAAIIAAAAVGIAVFLELVLMLVRRIGRSPNGDDVRNESAFRRTFDAGFDWVRAGPFNWLVTLAYNWRYVTLALSVGLILVVARGLTASGQVGFVFFPSPESENISASVIAHPGTPEPELVRAVQLYEEALRRAESKLSGDTGEKLIDATFVTVGSSGRSQGDNLARIKVQLTTSETRTIRTPDIVNAWREEAPQLTSIRRFSIRQSRGGPPGADIDVELLGPSIAVLKEAAVEVTGVVAAIPGVSGVEDDLPYGKPEIIMTLTPRGSALGFTLDSVGQQVRNAVDGVNAFRFARGDDEVAVQLTMASEREGSAKLREMYLRSPTGNDVPLAEIVTLQERQGFSAIQRKDGRTTISVTGDIDNAVTTTDDVTETLTTSGVLDQIVSKYGIDYRFGGRSQEQRDAFRDLGFGTMIAMAVIYIILAWVFGSYFKPFAVMLIIPFGAVGAVYGHWVMDFQLTILSLIGLLGLSGILVNDSIILVSRLQERLRLGEDLATAAIGASRDRFRAVLLTSLTTIGGLVPLLFETSLQAQFLKPMAITMVFGLATATVLVLFLVPVFLGIGQDIRNALIAIYGDRRPQRLQPGE